MIVCNSTDNLVHLLLTSVTCSEDGKVTAAMSTEARCLSALRFSSSTAIGGTSLAGEVTGLCCCCCCCWCWWCFRWRRWRWCFPLDLVCSWSRRPVSPTLFNHKRSDSNKRTLKRKKRGKVFLKNVCERLIKNFAEICHQSNYYLCTLSHVACQMLTLSLMSTNKTKRSFKKESPNDTVMHSS